MSQAWPEQLADSGGMPVRLVLHDLASHSTWEPEFFAVSGTIIVTGVDVGLSGIITTGDVGAGVIVAGVTVVFWRYEFNTLSVASSANWRGNMPLAANESFAIINNTADALDVAITGYYLPTLLLT